MIKWRVEKRKVKDLKIWKNNPRRISVKNYKKLVERIKTRGFHDVIKIDTDNTILSGNQRKRALLELGIEEVEVKVPDRKLTEEEKRKVALESNINDGEWDFDILANEFELETLEDVGFEDLKIKNIFGIMPDNEDWVKALEIKGKDSGFSQITFVLTHKQMGKVKRVLMGLANKKEIALLRLIEFYDSKANKET